VDRETRRRPLAGVRTRDSHHLKDGAGGESKPEAPSRGNRPRRHPDGLHPTPEQGKFLDPTIEGWLRAIPSLQPELTGGETTRQALQTCSPSCWFSPRP
jgi:hypothetical protein